VGAKITPVFYKKQTFFGRFVGLMNGKACLRTLRTADRAYNIRRGRVVRCRSLLRRVTGIDNDDVMPKKGRP
jgi:hypothetical protein